jgi:hypothetical protein
MKDTIQFKEVFDSIDDNQMRELLVRVAARMKHWAGDNLHDMLALPIATQMVIGYLNGVLVTMCQTNGIDLAQAPAVDGQGYDVHLELKSRH